MLHPRPTSFLAGLALCLTAALATAAETVKLEKTVTGTPEVKSINTIRFGPGGVPFIGDGAGKQVLAVETGGEACKAGFTQPVDGIKKKIAERLGATEKEIEIGALAVHPVTHVAHVVVRKPGKAIIATIDGDGKIGECTLENVKYIKINLPVEKNFSRVTDVAWGGDRLLISGASNEEFGAKIFSVPAPLTNDAKATVSSAETFHVAHNKWETRAPMYTLLPFEEEGKKYIAGSFVCTPVVKYPLDNLKDGEKVKGTSMVELGHGNQPIGMITYEKDGKTYILMNNIRRFHARQPIGPSPYWAVRFERNLLMGKDNVNQKALWRVKKGTVEPTSDQFKVLEDYHGVMLMDKLDGGRALTIKDDGKGNQTLVALALP